MFSLSLSRSLSHFPRKKSSFRWETDEYAPDDDDDDDDAAAVARSEECKYWWEKEGGGGNERHTGKECEACYRKENLDLDW